VSTIKLWPILETTKKIRVFHYGHSTSWWEDKCTATVEDVEVSVLLLNPTSFHHLYSKMLTFAVVLC
jgi:hypothetical protein